MRNSTTDIATPTIDFAAAHNDALAYWDQYDALVDLDLGDVLESVRSAACGIGCMTADDLYANAGDIIRRVTGLAYLNQFADASTANVLHSVRNATAAIIFASHMLNDRDAQATYTSSEPSRPSHRVGAARRGPPTTTKSSSSGRHLHSLRRGGRYTKPAVQYAVAESGAHPVETTAVRRSDFDNITAPTTVELLGDPSGTGSGPSR